ncbi:EAL domain-containing protein [Sphingomonas sp. ID1715]|uniref:putative bifunctional diguanylate cyclase/phosphodiesterase n=1 Tax=Sphingomonas sp. ID1715 TaxID=1656898 RepID=UPI0014876525|nr:EAL domain-containing protein [Sphingomonas sp. ID1715]NNM76068.1 EAL domain-containing protein [Sphingomonas sp. ID1715]
MRNVTDGQAQRDLILVGVTIAAAILLIGSAGSALSVGFRALGGQAVLNQALSVSAILNIALLLFSWRRYAEFRSESGRREEAERRLAKLSRQDSLTGLLNRSAFFEIGGARLRKARNRGKGAALLLLDLDHFKAVNDVNGHPIGDTTLQMVAALIEANLPDGAVAGRLGADEFGVLMLSAHAAGEADLLAEKLVTELGRRLVVGGAAVHTGASIGLASIESESDTLDQLMRRADIAMFAAKHAGRNRQCWFDQSMERELHMRNAIENGIRDGIPLGQFVPFYEQQIDLATGKLQGFEMLARWEHPTRGIIAPDVFIPIAEECGLIADLSMSVMRQALEEAKNWDPSLTLSVNIAPAQLRDPWFAHKIVKLLVETGFPANRLEIEITERSLAENMGVAQSVVGSLKNQGVRLALDDFGTGYSSLSNLRALPFDRVKIDRSFVTTLSSNAESAAIVNAITRLSDSLGLPVTAEGVETPEIEAQLKSLGCFHGQGWHFGKPMDVGQVRAMLAQRNLLPVRRLAAPAGERVRELRRQA